MIDLDCEVEILTTENEESDAPPELESVNGNGSGDEQPDNVLDHLLDAEEDEEEGDDDEQRLEASSTPTPPPSLPPQQLQLPNHESNDNQLAVATIQPTTPPKETSLSKRKKRYSEDIPNSLKEPEKRISRSGRQVSIHYNIYH